MNLSNLLFPRLTHPANKNEPHVKSEIEIVKKFQHLIKSFLMVWTENFAKPGQKCFDQSQVN